MLVGRIEETFFRWMGEMSVSNRPFPEEMGGQMSTRGIMLD